MLIHSFDGFLILYRNDNVAVKHILNIRMEILNLSAFIVPEIEFVMIPKLHNVLLRVSIGVSLLL